MFTFPVLDSSVVLPLKEHPSDLVIANQEALDNENAERVVKQSITPQPPASPQHRLTPVIRVWEGEFELVETAGQRVETPPNKSHSAWEGEFNNNTETQSDNPTLVDKATSMAHELVHLMKSNESHGDGSDIELDDVFHYEKRNKKNKEDQLNLLNPKNSDLDDDAELHSLSSLEDNDRPSFQSSQLALDSTQTTPTDIVTGESNSEPSTTSNAYSREDSVPVVIETDNYGVKNPSFSEQTDGTTLDVSQGAQQKSNRKSSRTSVNSSTSSKQREESYEMQDLRVGSMESRHLSSSSEPHEESGLLSSPAVGMTTQYGKLHSQYIPSSKIAQKNSAVECIFVCMALHFE